MFEFTDRLKYYHPESKAQILTERNIPSHTETSWCYPVCPNETQELASPQKKLEIFEI